MLYNYNDWCNVYSNKCFELYYSVYYYDLCCTVILNWHLIKCDDISNTLYWHYIQNKYLYDEKLMIELSTGERLWPQGQCCPRFLGHQVCLEAPEEQKSMTFIYLRCCVLKQRNIGEELIYIQVVRWSPVPTWRHKHRKNQCEIVTLHKTMFKAAICNQDCNSFNVHICRKKRTSRTYRRSSWAWEPLKTLNTEIMLEKWTFSLDLSLCLSVCTYWVKSVWRYCAMKMSAS